MKNDRFILFILMFLLALSIVKADFSFLGTCTGESKYEVPAWQLWYNSVNYENYIGFVVGNSTVNVTGGAVLARGTTGRHDLVIALFRNGASPTTPQLANCSVPSGDIGTGYSTVYYGCNFTTAVVLEANTEYFFGSPYLESGTNNAGYYQFENASKTSIVTHMIDCTTASCTNGTNYAGALIYFNTYTAPDITSPILTYISQNPTTINQSNLLSVGLNITYNITDNVAVNNATVYLNVTVENTNENITYYRNGTAVRGAITYTYSVVNVSNFYTWNLDENQIYFGLYNHNESYFELQDKKYYDCNKSSCQYQIEIYNFTNKSVNVVELGLRDTGTPIPNAEVILCNAPNVYNPVANTSNCTLVFQNNVFPAEHSHRGGKSNHSTFTFTFNTTNRNINGLYLPNVIYANIILNNNYPSNRYWSFAYIDGTSRTNSIKYWNSVTNIHNELNVSFDFHIHQIQPNQTKVYYKACGTDTNSNSACSTERMTTIVTEYIAPDTPIFINPNVTQTFTNPAYVYVSWNNPVSPMGATGKSIELNLSYSNGSTSTLTTDSTLPLITSYAWPNTQNLTDITLILKYCDENNYCSVGSSVNFTTLYYVLPISDNALLININASLISINSELEDLTEGVNMIGFIILWLGLWIFGYYCMQTNNDLLGGTMIVLTVPLNLYFSYALQESFILGTGFMGIAFGLMTAWTFGVFTLIKRTRKGSITQ